MKDRLFLNNMLTPKIITVIYWLLALSAIVSGLATIFAGSGGFTANLLGGLFIVFLGTIGARIWCELTIVLFKMNEALQEMRRK